MKAILFIETGTRIQAWIKDNIDVVRVNSVVAHGWDLLNGSYVDVDVDRFRRNKVIRLYERHFRPCGRIDRARTWCFVEHNKLVGQLLRDGSVWRRTAHTLATLAMLWTITLGFAPTVQETFTECDFEAQLRSVVDWVSNTTATLGGF